MSQAIAKIESNQVVVSPDQSKVCIKCGAVKLFGEFYEGNRCNDCVKAYTKIKTAELRQNPEWLAKERDRCRKKEQAFRDAGGKGTRKKECVQRWKAKNRLKWRAVKLAGMTQLRGKLKPKTKCEMCGSEGLIHRHHDDYSKPLKVRWLCPKCHGFVHRKPL